MNAIDGILDVLPSRLIEATNGAIVALLVFVIGGFGAYIFEHWLMVRCPGERIWSPRPIFIVYHERKAAIALLWGFTGFEIRTFAVWLPRHLANLGIRPTDVLSEWLAPAMLITGTIMAIIGCACWLRVTIPIRITNWTFGYHGRRIAVGHLVWFLIAMLCVIWGCWMAWR